MWNKIKGFAAPFRMVSKAAADLMAYCEAHIREDPLIVPVPASENPFREKKFFCTIL
ncbi:guanine nucleotide-binding protein G(I)/G(S)/G(O) subunit gamma-4 [Neolamprologus brichardi]|uniref:guanine nucleotide-binding protein G(I)/G(S)/G(O) subunit gamma-4 n=1 Tax=Neolamprologus brichardi TaxID=32507 RepID=UPI001643CAF9|nr:guanine nucleotide-binding protein G(I)/G(S)/G(O) subunit gamma-4 [Neolamprologus brichardi]